MEEKKKRRLPNSVSKGQFFRGLDPLTDAQRSFIADWYPWAMKYAETDISRRKRKNDITPPEIIRDTAVNTLIYAAINWKPDGGCSFKTYFHFGFYSSVSNAVKKYYDDKSKTVSENEKTKVQHEGGHGFTTIADTICCDDDMEDSVLSDVYVDQLLSCLTPHQRELVTKCCFEGEKQTDVARELGVSKQAVHQAIANAYATLRKVLGVGIKAEQRGRLKNDAQRN